MFGRMATAGLDLSETRGVLMCRFIKKRLGFTALYCLSSAPAGAGTRPNPRHSRLSDVVGYVNKNVEAGKFYLVGVQFNKVGEANSKVDINDFISMSADFHPGTYESDFVGAPDIQVLNEAGTGYTHYFYISDATNDDDQPLGYDCWADMDGYELKDADKLALGKGFWFKATANGSITVAGQVASGASKPVDFLGNQFFIMANPYPTAVSFASVSTTGVIPSTYESDFAGSADIQVLNAAATGYNHYFYISDATNADDEPVGYNCWADMDGYILDGTTQVEPGASFWIKSNANGTMGFAR